MECRKRSSALKESLGLKSKYRLKPGSIPTLKAPNIESTVILSWATFHMLSTNKMAALPTCDDVGSTKSQRFSDFLCVMHIVPSTKSRFIEFSKDSWSKFVSFGTKLTKFDCREGEIEIGLRCTQLCTCVHGQCNHNGIVNPLHFCITRIIDSAKGVLQ